MQVSLIYFRAVEICSTFSQSCREYRELEVVYDLNVSFINAHVYKVGMNSGDTLIENQKQPKNLTGIRIDCCYLRGVTMNVHNNKIDKYSFGGKS